MFVRLSSIFVLATVACMAQPANPLPAAPSPLRKPVVKPVVLPRELQGVGINQRLNQQVPLNLVFRDEAGRQLPLSTYFQGHKPVVLALVYFRCPMLCTQILSGLETSLKSISLNPGKDFEVMVVSFDPTDTPEAAEEKKEVYLKRYSRPNTANGWHFLTGDETDIKALTDAVGFHYRYDPKLHQFAHASGVMIMTSKGKLSRYFYGVQYSPRDVRLGLVEASNDKIGNPVDQVLLFCYHYDPGTGKYGAIAMRMVQLGGAIFVLISSCFLFFAWRRDFRKDRRALKQAR